MTEAVLIAAVFALAIVRSLTVLPDMVLVPFAAVIPLISPAVPADALVVPLVSFEMVLPIIETVPVPVLYIPYTVCEAAVEGEAALMLLLVPASVLPMVLAMMVVVPPPLL